MLASLRDDGRTTAAGNIPPPASAAAICHAACSAIGLRRIAHNPFTLIVKVLKVLNVPNDLNDLKGFNDFIKCRTTSLAQKTTAAGNFPPQDMYVKE